MSSKSCFASAALCAAVMAMPSVAAAEAADGRTAPVIATETGKLKGEWRGDIRIFKGIPYAAPPVGNLRWRPPVRAAGWRGVRDATRFGNDCVQKRAEWDAARANEPMGEDCLFLNIWAPGHRSRRGLPVMVWIHGGNFTAGSGAQSIYDGARLAARGVVIVTINYRLGRFGFFAHPALTREAAGAPLGNYGIMDQIAALKWVKRNIAAFGGDPARVTIFGESAGGGSVNMLMLAPDARGLFVGAIAQSGGGRDRPAALSADRPERKAAETVGKAFAVAHGVADDDVAALRSIPAEALRGNISLLNPEADSYSGPFIDGQILRESIDAGFAAGRQAPVPYLVGANSDEIGYIPAAFRGPLTAKMARDARVDVAGLQRAYGSKEAFEAHFASDLTFVEPARFLAAAAAKNGTWLYSFDYVAHAKRKAGVGAPHTADLPFVFGNLEVLGVPPTPADAAMARLIGDYWVAFAKTGKPDGEGRPAWPRFTPADPQRLEFQADAVVAGSAASVALDAIAAHHAAAAKP